MYRGHVRPPTLTHWVMMAGTPITQGVGSSSAMGLRPPEACDSGVGVLPWRGTGVQGTVPTPALQASCPQPSWDPLAPSQPWGLQQDRLQPLQASPHFPKHRGTPGCSCSPGCAAEPVLLAPSPATAAVQGLPAPAPTVRLWSSLCCAGREQTPSPLGLRTSGTLGTFWIFC